MRHCRITVFSHGVKVDQMSSQAKTIVHQFARNFVQYGYRSVPGSRHKEKYMKCAFAAAPFDRREYRFARAALDDLIQYLYLFGIPKELMEMYERPMYEPVRISVAMPKSWVPRERQVPIIEYCCQPGHIKAVTMQTGQGKTGLTLKVIELLGVRTMIILPAKYTDQWTDKLSEAFGLGPDRLIVVKGFKHLCALMQLAYIGEFSKDVIVVTSTTMNIYLNYYEETRPELVPDWFIHPDELYEKLGIGLRVLDEAHEFFHLNFKMDMYLHIPKSQVLSATLDPDDSFLKQMYQLIFPLSVRMSGGSYIKYIDATAFMYHLEFWDRVKYQGAQGYSHTIYEQWLQKKSKTLGRYLKMIKDIVVTEYIAKRKPGQKMLIYAATIEMCQIIRDYLEEALDEDLTVNKYTGEDEFHTLLTSDISVTTLGSAGTGVDVPGLITCLMTTALSSGQRNIQVLGRLRELHDHPGQNPHFIYLVCRDINKHIEYHEKKKQLFLGKVLTHKTIVYDQRV